MGKGSATKALQLLLRGCGSDVCVLYPLLRSFIPHCTPSAQLGIKMTSIYSHRLSHSCLDGEIQSKTNCGCV